MKVYRSHGRERTGLFPSSLCRQPEFSTRKYFLAVVKNGPSMKVKTRHWFEEKLYVKITRTSGTGRHGGVERTCRSADRAVERPRSAFSIRGSRDLHNFLSHPFASMRRALRSDASRAIIGIKLHAGILAYLCGPVLPCRPDPTPLARNWLQRSNSLSQLLRPENKRCVPTHTWRSSARVAKNAEVVAIVELDLGFPGSSCDDAPAKSR